MSADVGVIFLLSAVLSLPILFTAAVDVVAVAVLVVLLILLDEVLLLDDVGLLVMMTDGDTASALSFFIIWDTDNSRVLLLVSLFDGTVGIVITAPIVVVVVVWSASVGTVASTGLVVASVGLVVTLVGSVVASEVSVVASAGSIVASAGSIVASAGSVVALSGEVIVTGISVVASLVGSTVGGLVSSVFVSASSVHRVNMNPLSHEQYVFKHTVV